MRWFLLLLSSFCPAISAQILTEPVEGLRENTPQLHVLRGAKVWINPGEAIDKGVVLLSDGTIVSVGTEDLKVPEGAREWDLTGKTVYAGFIESVATLGKPGPVSDENTHWNKLVRPERRAVGFTEPSKDDIKKLRGLGFTTAQNVPDKGIFRGQTNVVSLGNKTEVIQEDGMQAMAFEKADTTYPNSLMGTVALIRQTLQDARWYRDLSEHVRKNPEVERPQANTALAALQPVVDARQSILMSAGDELDYSRILGLAREFQLRKPGIIGNGREYRQLEPLQEAGVTLVLPLNFPKPPPVENPDLALDLSLEQLEHWELAPANAAMLAKAGVPICLTTQQLEKPEDFWKQVRKAVSHGLEPAQALAALTTQPAGFLDMADRLGSIEKGKFANLVVSDGDLFSEEDAKIHAVWVNGLPFETEASKKIDIRGTWKLEWQGVQADISWEVKGKPSSPSLKIDDKDFGLQLKGEQVLVFPNSKFFGQDEGSARMVGRVNKDEKSVVGSGVLANGSTFSWSATYEPAKPPCEEEEPQEKPKEAAFSKYPAGAYGVSGSPAQPSVVLVKNATIWTSGPKGRIDKADLLVKRGKIVKIAKEIPVISGTVVIDAQGKHVTPGLIDCHSHSGISRGVNESTHAVTVEVRIGDVVDPTDIALYRELAGGLTTANLLHGSANPMGGQNQVIKLRWGSRSGNELHLKGAKPGVKFALGENVKQSNWTKKTNRYPQTRMGVEQIMKDTFLAAKDYRKAQEKAAAEGRPHRRNLRLDAILEILDGDRIVHIHSYRQDEILMFVRLAQEFGFTVGTFQHVLEGYKVADAIAEINAGGSSFSDWWAYKFEVYDAIPYNGALMQRAGVVTSFNSDSNELATRMNTEAAKAVKYGGLSEEEALKFVTINPAIQLHIQDRVGSIEPGKDADFVIWNGHPLSSFSKAEQTWIDGRKYFDLEDDRKMREQALSERRRLIAKALPERISAIAKKKGEKEDEGKEKNPTLSQFIQRLRDQRCTNAYQLLYHNGQEAYNCSGNCCTAR